VRVVYPLFLVGSYFGVIFYIILSELWIAIIIIGSLGTLSIQMIFKSRQKFMAESKKIAQEEAKARGEDNYVAVSDLQAASNSINSPPETVPLAKEEETDALKTPLLD